MKLRMPDYVSVAVCPAAEHIARPAGNLIWIVGVSRVRIQVVLRIKRVDVGHAVLADKYAVGDYALLYGESRGVTVKGINK